MFKHAILIAATLLPVSAKAAGEAELRDQIATIINLNGHLCAEVTEVKPLRIENQYEITCIEYRGGSGTVRYILDALKGTAFPAG